MEGFKKGAIIGGHKVGDQLSDLGKDCKIAYLKEHKQLVFQLGEGGCTAATLEEAADLLVPPEVVEPIPTETIPDETA